jgi:DNA-binding LacI/PurR family transcriptional regulator
VAQATTELGYVPNSAARHLRGTSTGVIALALPEALNRSSYYMSFAFGALAEATRHDYDLAIVADLSARAGLRPLRADGLLISDPRVDDPFIAALAGSPITVVTCEPVPEGPAPDGLVWSRHREAIHELMDEVAASGARRPALLACEGTVEWSRQVALGYTEWCRDRRCEPLTATLPYEATWAQMRETAADLLARHPDIDALVCGPDGSAVEIASVLALAGHEIGRTLAVAACVDSDRLEMHNPPITAIDVRPREAGATCARLLFDIVAGTAPANTQVEHAVRVVRRASTARLPA